MPVDSAYASLGGSWQRMSSLVSKVKETHDREMLIELRYYCLYRF